MPGEIERGYRDIIQGARRLLESGSPVSARDAIHVAVMRAHGIRRVMTFDRALGAIAGIERLGITHDVDGGARA